MVESSTAAQLRRVEWERLARPEKLEGARPFRASAWAAWCWAEHRSRERCRQEVEHRRRDAAAWAWADWAASWDAEEQARR